MRKTVFAPALAIELAVAMLGWTVSADATKLQVLYSFCSAPHCSDGSAPIAPPIRDAGGNLFGTTYAGGTYYGTIYKLAPDGAETVLYVFDGDGGYIRDSLVMDRSGNLFGTSDFGGTANAGLVFKLAADGTESTLYNFAGGTGGAYPEAGLIIDSQGNLYGTTYYGGSANCDLGCGTVFKVTPDGTETVLYRFCETSPSCNDGAGPHATVLADRNGNLYGTTVGGGTNDSGTVFRLNPDGKERVLYSFAGGTDGQWPFAGLVADKAGNLYGTTEYGGAQYGGAVFKIAPDGTETILYSFCDCGDGAMPTTALAIDGKGYLYGTTTTGSSHECGEGNCGVIFKLSPDGTETLLRPSVRGASQLLQDGMGQLLGVTDEGGAHKGGAVFVVNK
jgi:uncharacterized repeat protein (TIGR03803 family)